MSRLHQFVYRPHCLWLRRAFFQVHLWVGITLSLYLAVIGITGSILVFVTELERFAYVGLTRPALEKGQQTADLVNVIDEVRRAYPTDRVETVYCPRTPDENFLAIVRRHDADFRYVYADALTGRVSGRTDLNRSWISWLADLHINLLADRTGKIVNGIGATSLLILCVTGPVIWWRGLRAWRRGLVFDLRKSWRRINLDAHSALGFWALGFLVMWAVSGAYYVWPDRFVAVVTRISPVKAAFVDVRAAGPGRPSTDLHALVSRAAAAVPAARLAGMTLPVEEGDPIAVLMAGGKLGDFTHMNYVYFDPSTGEHLSTWQRGSGHSAGDWTVWLMAPLHFGMYWGRAVQIIWAVVGLALPFMATTGLLMYWNRVLAPRLAE